PACARSRRSHGRRAGNAATGAGGSHLPRWHETGHGNGANPMTDDDKNPFAPTQAELEKRRGDASERPQHASDDPGVEYDNADVLNQDEPTKSSGASSPSQPRRPGTGGRHAPYHEEKRKSSPVPHRWCP